MVARNIGRASCSGALFLCLSIGNGEAVEVEGDKARVVCGRDAWRDDVLGGERTWQVYGPAIDQIGRCAIWRTRETEPPEELKHFPFNIHRFAPFLLFSIGTRAFMRVRTHNQQTHAVDRANASAYLYAPTNY
jgi:hypothetical protein